MLGTLLACGAAAALILALAPAEQTLGAGIRWVYAHVALVWTGLTGLAAAGLLGAGLLVWGDRRLAAWAQTTGWTACAFFAGGLALSLAAAQANWGGIFWQEPRMAAALRALAVAVIAVGAAGWLAGRRWAGLLYLLPAAYAGWAVRAAPLVLHPQNAALGSPSLAIRGTFLALFAVFSLAAFSLVAYLSPIEQSGRPPTLTDV